MAVFLRPIARALGLTIACASVAGAQGEKSCDINEGRPTPVGRATLAIQVASGTQDPNAAARQLTAAVKGLTENADRMDNQVGRNFVLGKALVLWTMQPDVELVAQRGRLGYTSNPEGTTDLAAAIDTAFKVVEAANPECISETSRWRGQKAWVTLVNTAIERLNADDIDDAEASAQRAIVLNPFGPYGYVVLANIMQKRERSTEAFALYRKAVETASRDTVYDDIRRQSLLYLGNLAADSAELADGAEARRPYIETARTAFQEILSDAGAGDVKANARTGLCRVVIASGDTSQVKEMYKEQIAAPASYSYSELMNAGVCMARAELVPDGTTLFRAALEKNRYHRDALSNLAIMLLRTDSFDESTPIAKRLVAVEPNNPENVQLLVLSYAGIAQRVRGLRTGGTRAAPAATKTGAKAAPTTTKAAPAARMSQAVLDSLFRVEAAYTDSAVKTNERRENMAFRVSLSDFTFTDERASLSGSIMNSGADEKVVPMKVDFLDRSGTVVSSSEVSVIVPGGRSARFSAVVAPGNKEISAFRYAEIK